MGISVCIKISSQKFKERQNEDRPYQRLYKKYNVQRVKGRDVAYNKMGKELVRVQREGQVSIFKPYTEKGKQEQLSWS